MHNDNNNHNNKRETKMVQEKGVWDMAKQRKLWAYRTETCDQKKQMIDRALLTEAEIQSIRQEVDENQLLTDGIDPNSIIQPQTLQEADLNKQPTKSDNPLEEATEKNTKYRRKWTTNRMHRAEKWILRTSSSGPKYAYEGQNKTLKAKNRQHT